MYTGVRLAFEWASRKIIKTIKLETGNFQKFAYVLFLLLDISVFCKNVWALFRTSDTIQ